MVYMLDSVEEAVSCIIESCVVLYYGWWHGDRSLQVLKVSQQNGDSDGFSLRKMVDSFFSSVYF